MNDIVSRFKVALAALALAIPAVAGASPITYEFFLVTNGSIGKWNFTNALVHFTLQGDTTQATFYPLLLGQLNIWLNPSVSGSVSVMSQGKTVKGNIAAGQLFVSIDQAGGGVGLGSCTDQLTNLTVPCGNLTSTTINVLPTYPIGIQDGIPDCIIGDGDCVTPSAAVGTRHVSNTTVVPVGGNALPVDLKSSSMMSGRAWSDPSFATPNASTDGAAIPTSAGPFSLKRPYSDFDDPLVTGIYRATAH